MDLPRGTVVLRSMYGPANWLSVDVEGSYKLSASAKDQGSATRFTAETINNDLGYFSLRAISRDGSPIGWLSRIRLGDIDYLESRKTDIDVFCKFQYHEIQPNGRLFAVSLPLDNKQYWRLDVDNNNLIKPDAPTYLDSNGLQANKLCLFSYENI